MAIARWSPITMFLTSLFIAWFWLEGASTIIGHGHAISAGIVITAACFCIGLIFKINWIKSINCWFLSLLCAYFPRFASFNGWPFYWDFGGWNATLHSWGGIPAENFTVYYYYMGTNFN
jgi:hypothetical protein